MSSSLKKWAKETGQFIAERGVGLSLTALVGTFVAPLVVPFLGPFALPLLALSADAIAKKMTAPLPADKDENRDATDEER